VAKWQGERGSLDMEIETSKKAIHVWRAEKDQLQVALGQLRQAQKSYNDQLKERDEIVGRLAQDHSISVDVDETGVRMCACCLLCV
jgi:anti-sigma-K factor RskA